MLNSNVLKFEYLGDTTLFTFDEAEAECVRRGGHLASLHSQAEAEKVLKLCGQKDSWLGLRRKAEGKWTCCCCCSVFVWTCRN